MNPTINAYQTLLDVVNGLNRLAASSAATIVRRVLGWCDACSSARALVEVTKDGSSVELCGHHYRKNEDKLILSGFAVTESQLESA